MNHSAVLSLFPGAGLLDQAFTEAGYTVFRGPDLLQGGDIRDWHCIRDVFAGVIGGPPCQPFSLARAADSKPKHPDGIPDFVRVVAECRPAWVVMENVRGAINHHAIPATWHPSLLRDWDCGGRTHRTRVFFTWPFPMLSPPRRPGRPSRSLLAGSMRACSFSRTRPGTGYLDARKLSIRQLSLLAGDPACVPHLIEARANKTHLCHLLGNGVPLAMGRYVAQHVATLYPPQTGGPDNG